MSEEKIERLGSGGTKVVETDGKKTSAELDAEYYAEQAREDDGEELPLTLKQGEQLAGLNLKDLALVLVLPKLEGAIKSALANKNVTEIKTRLKLTPEQSAIWDKEFAEWLTGQIMKVVKKAI